MSGRRMNHGVVFLDLIMNALLCFTALFIIAYVQIRPENMDDPALETEGKFVVVMRWDDRSEDDVDLYVMDPAGNIAYFQDRDSGLMHLEHDDLGARNDSLSLDTGTVTVERNEERVILRGVIPGEYTVNIHMYRKDDAEPTTVTVALYRLVGADARVLQRERALVRNGHEETVFRFTLDGAMAISNINELPREIAGGLVGQQGGAP